jgi:CMP-N,N'-diacetyllegionaminic acid synthase
MDRATCIALIPARAGSKRVPGKNVRPFYGHPLIAYTIAAARQSGVFDAIAVSTDSAETAAIATHYGAEVPFLRPAAQAGDLSPDIQWLADTLRKLHEQGRDYDAFSILRPTSPFRLPETIRRAWELFISEAGADSLRAVEKCKQHPGKMWVIRGQASRRMTPLLPFLLEGQPWHSNPTQALPEVYVQNASLEIAWTRVVLEGGTIAGETVIPFPTQGHEGFDINQPDDMRLADELLQSGQARLPRIDQPAHEGRQAA